MQSNQFFNLIYLLLSNLMQYSFPLHSSSIKTEVQHIAWTTAVRQLGFVIVCAIQINLREMFINSRIKMNSKKLSSAISPQTNSLISSNPQIQNLVDKLFLISESVCEARPATLNLIQWQKQKYRPNEKQNRIRIENQISMIKICNQKVRSRVKPIKRASSNDSKSTKSNKTYKAHYDQIKGERAHNPRSQSYESEEELDNMLNQNISEPKMKTPIRYYQSLKKYSKIVQFINERIEHRSESKKKHLKSYYSQGFATTPHSVVASKSMSKPNPQKSKFIEFGDAESNLKVQSIAKKWKPMSKMQRIFNNTTMNVNRKRLSWEGSKQRHIASQPSKLLLPNTQEQSNCDSQLSGQY